MSRGTRLVWAPGTAGSSEQTLALPDGVRPGLECAPRCPSPSGPSVPVRTVFSLLRERLERFRPEQAAAHHRHRRQRDPPLRARVRQGALGADPLAVGNVQEPPLRIWSSAPRSCSPRSPETSDAPGAAGARAPSSPSTAWAWWRCRIGSALPYLAWTAVRVLSSARRGDHEFESMFVPSTIFHAVHGGLLEFEGAAEHGDPLLPRGRRPYLKEALAEGALPGGPAAGRSLRPRSSSRFCGNVLRHSRMGEQGSRHALRAGAAGGRRELPHERDQPLRRHPASRGGLVREDRHQVHRRLRSLRDTGRQGRRPARRGEARVGDLLAAVRARRRGGTARGA